MSSLEPWQPAVYLKFGRERTQPSVDLAARIEVDGVRRVLDIGCGPGNSTGVLKARWPAAHITGLDSSPEMIGRAKADYPDGDWVVADIREWHPGQSCDVVFSNATLHWVPEHERLIPRLFDMVRRGGAIAAQVPSVQDSPVHRAARRLAETGGWSRVLARGQEALTWHSEVFYYDQLAPLSTRVELWHTTYYHLMSSHQEIIQWYSGSGLKAYLSRLSSEREREDFKEAVLAACQGDYPVLRDGKVLFPFKRFFMVAYRA